MTKKYFGTDGIRGKVNQTKINGEMFFKFGLAAGTYFKNQPKFDRFLEKSVNFTRSFFMIIADFPDLPTSPRVFLSSYVQSRDTPYIFIW